MMIQRTASPTVLCFVIAGALTASAQSAFAKATTKVVGSTVVERIETRKTDAGREIVIHTSKDATFSVFRLSDPFRVLVDVNDATTQGPTDVSKIGDGLVRYISTSPFSDETSAIVRVEIALDYPSEYRVRPEGKAIVVSIADHGKLAPPPAQPAPAAPSAQAEAKPAVAPAPEAKATASEADVAAPARAEPARSEGLALQLGQMTKRLHKGKAELVTKIEQGTIDAGAVHVEHVESPSRIVVDVKGAQISPKWQKVEVNSLGVRRARVGSTEEGVRIVLDLAEGRPVPALDVDTVNGNLLLSLSRTKTVAKAAIEPASPNAGHAEVAVAEREDAEPASAGAAESAAETSAEPAAKMAAQVGKAATPEQEARATARVSDVRFEPKDGFVRLTLTLDGDSEVQKDAQSLPELPVLRIKGAVLPQTLERTLDVSEVAGQAVHAVSTYRDGADTIISASIGQGTEHRHWRKGNRIMWDFRSQVAQNDAGKAAKVLPYPEQSTSGFVSSAVQLGATLAPQAQHYTGRRITLDLKDAEIQNVLRLLADVSKLNIVASDDVHGRVTVKLRNVPWDQALDIILRSKQLDKTRVGNIIRVAPVEVLRKEEELRIERNKSKQELEPLAVRLIPVSYAVANEVKPQVQSLLSPRGKVNIDTRTNVLVVEDIPDVLTKVERLVRTLDTQTPQVLIEARIVEANTQFARDLGVQWGGNVSMSQQFGTATGLGFPNQIRIAGGSDDVTTPTEGVVPNPQFAVNLPATVGTGGGGALGFVFGSAGGAALINVRLSAAESTGKVKIISAPKVVTLDNKSAKILSGEKIPITVVTANGPTTRFIDANLELNVTPHVTQDGSILLNVSARKNELSDRRDLLGVPGVLTKEAETEMLVRDGDTAVLGGIYKRTSNETKNYVPWIGQVPVLGWIFKKTTKSDAREELLIFISPRIVNRNQALVQAQ